MSDGHDLFNKSEKQLIKQGIEEERRRVLNLIEEMKQEVKDTRLHSADVIEAFNELRKEVELEYYGTKQEDYRRTIKERTEKR